MDKITYEEGKRIAIQYGYDDYGEPLKEFRLIQDHCCHNSGGILEEIETSCTLISVRKNGKCGLIDSNNNIKLPFEYDDLFCNCKNGILVLRKNGKFGGLYRYNLNSVAFDFKYDYLGCIYNMTFNALFNGYYGLLKPGDIQLTGFKYRGFLIHDGGRYTRFDRINFWGNDIQGQIDLETGEELS